MNLANINLNLLVSLDALLDTCNVTRAAEQLHISQSAMSKTLAQLRDMFQDPLLVRVGNRFVPTARAEQIRGGLKQLLHNAAVLLESEEFDPVRCDTTFTIAVTDYVAQFILPDVLQHIYRQAPHIGIRLIDWDQHSLQGLTGGRIDLGTGSLEHAPANFYVRKIDEDSLVCVMAPGHPLACQGLTMEGYLAYSHAVITSGGDKHRRVDKALAALGFSRRVGLEVPYYRSALHIIAGTDMLLTLPEHIARHTAGPFGLVQFPLPFESPHFEYSLIWHERQHHQAGHRWLRQVLMDELRRSVFAH